MRGAEVGIEYDSWCNVILHHASDEQGGDAARDEAGTAKVSVPSYIQ